MWLLFGTELKTNDNIEYPSRLTQMTTAQSPSLYVDDLDELNMKLWTHIKVSSTKKKGRERLSVNQELNLEEAPAGYVGSGNDEGIIHFYNSLDFCRF